MMATRLRGITAFTIVATAIAIYVLGFIQEPRLRGGDAEERAFARQVIKSQTRDMSEEKALADAYWRRYSDVAANPVVGRNGALGVYGAREHYNRHGKRENRIWGPPTDKKSPTAND